MKKTDIAMIILIASISVIAAFFITKGFFGDDITEEVTVKTVDKIDASITEPNAAIFNSNAINPSVEVNIGAGSR